MSKHSKMIVTTFVVGISLGVVFAAAYVWAVMRFFKFDSASLFQTFTILAFFGFIAPTARVSITLLLRGLERGDETADILRDLKANALPLIKDTKEVVAEFKGMNVQQLSDKIHDLIKKLEAKAVDGMIENL